LRGIKRDTESNRLSFKTSRESTSSPRIEEREEERREEKDKQRKTEREREEEEERSGSN